LRYYERGRKKEEDTGKMPVLLSLGTLSPSSALRDSIHPGNADLPIGFMLLKSNPIRQYGDWRSREGRKGTRNKLRYYERGRKNKKTQERCLQEYCARCNSRAFD
jgi:hypothetical protein